MSHCEKNKKNYSTRKDKTHMATAKKRGNSWRVLVYDYTDAEGKKHYKSFTGKTKRETEAMALDYQYSHTKKEKMTVGEAMKKYIEVKSPVLSPTTIRNYDAIYRNNLKGIMDIYISDITAEAVQAEISKESKTHAAKTVKNMHGLLSSVLAMYAPNVKLSTKLPQEPKNEIIIPDKDEIKRLLQACDDLGKHNIKLAIMLAFMGPLRLSEVSAITPADIEGTKIKITKARVYVKGGYEIKLPKTRAGTRLIEYPQSIIDMIRVKRPDQYIIQTTPNGLVSQYRFALRHAGLPRYRFHALRHYGASLLMSEGFPIDYIMERGGWESRETLERIYQHTMTSVRDSLTKKYLESLQEYS